MRNPKNSSSPNSIQMDFQTHQRLEIHLGESVLEAADAELLIGGFLCLTLVLSALA